MSSKKAGSRKNKNDSENEAIELEVIVKAPKVLKGELTASDEEKPVQVVVDDIDNLKPEFNIHEERQKWCRISAATLIPAVMIAFFTCALYVSGGMRVAVLPEPDFIQTSFLPGYRHEFFSLQKSFKDADGICQSRGGLLLYFNGTKEHEKFNEFVLETFKPHIDNATTNWYAKRALQIWTSVRIAFKAQKKAQLVWPGKVDDNVEMMKFYAESQDKRMCVVSSLEQARQIAKALSSKYGEEHYIVKDYSNRLVNIAKEPGCWQIRILDDSESLYLPFVCKVRLST